MQYQNKSTQKLGRISGLQKGFWHNSKNLYHLDLIFCIGMKTFNDNFKTEKHLCDTL